MPTGPTTTDRVLIAAARLRVTTDRKLGLQTPEWVMELAGKDEDGLAETATDPMYP